MTSEDKPQPRFVESLNTERLIIRRPRLEDAQVLTEAINASHPELRQWMDWAVDPQTLERSEDYCRRSTDEWEKGEAFPALMFLRDDQTLIGGTGLVRADWHVPKTELDYWCATTHVGNGYITEAARALTRYAFESLGMVRVELRMDDRNHRSWAVAERLGFTFEATLAKDARATDGSLRDTRIYTMFDLSALT